MGYTNVGTTFFRFVTNHAFDRRTDRIIISIVSTASAFHAAR